MGGARRYPFPKWVWSPAGGWWYGNPPHWKRNTVIWTGVLWLSMYGFVKYAEPRTTLYCPKTREVEFGKADARYVPKTEEEKLESARLEAIAAHHADAIASIPQEEVDRVIEQEDDKTQRRKEKLEELNRIRAEITRLKGKGVEKIEV